MKATISYFPNASKRSEKTGKVLIYLRVSVNRQKAETRLVSSHNEPNKDAGPYVNLPGDNKRDMHSFNMTILFNTDETFKAVEFGGNQYSVEEWNKKFTSLDPKDKKVSTATTNDGKFETKK